MIFRSINNTYAVLDQVLVSGGNFLTILICAYFFSPDEQGKLGFILSVYMGLMVVNQTFLFQQAAIDYPRKKNKTQYRTSLAKSQFMVAIMAGSAGMVLLFLMSGLSDWVMKAEEMIVVSFYFFIQQLTDCSRRASYIFYSAKKSALFSCITYIPRIFLLLAIKPEDVTTAFLLMSIASMVVVIIDWRVVIKSRFKFSYEFNSLRRQGGKKKWLLMTGLFSWVASALPVYFLGAFGSMSQVGIYITLRSIVGVANVFLEIVETEISSKAGKAYLKSVAILDNLLRKVSALGVIFWITGAIFFHFFNEKLMLYFYRDIYLGYGIAFQIMWIGIGITFLFRINAVKLRTIGESRITAEAYSVAVLIIIISGYLMKENFSIYSAAYLICMGATANFFFQVVRQKYLCFEKERVEYD